MAALLAWRTGKDCQRDGGDSRTPLDLDSVRTLSYDPHHLETQAHCIAAQELIATTTGGNGGLPSRAPGRLHAVDVGARVSCVPTTTRRHVT